jgi:hypothetical protein
MNFKENRCLDERKRHNTHTLSLSLSADNSQQPHQHVDLKKPIQPWDAPSLLAAPQWSLAAL